MDLLLHLNVRKTLQNYNLTKNQQRKKKSCGSVLNFEHLLCIFSSKSDCVLAASELFIINCFMFRSTMEEHGKSISSRSVIETRCRKCQRGCTLNWSNGCFGLWPGKDHVFWVTACKEGTFFFKIDEVPVKRWGQRNPFTLKPSHSIRSGDAKQLPAERNVSFLLKILWIPVWIWIQ